MPGGFVSFYEYGDFTFTGADASELGPNQNGPLSSSTGLDISFTFSGAATPPQTIEVQDDDDFLEDDFQEGAGFNQQVTEVIQLADGTVIGNPGDFIEVEFTVTFEDSNGSTVDLLFGAFAPDGSGADAGNLTMVFSTAPLVPGETYTFVSSSDGGGTAYGGLICFARGTRLLTPTGERAVEDLHEGDPVTLSDGRVMPVRWIGQRRVGAGELALRPELRPVRIRAGAFGPGRPARDLVVSPQHRVVVDHWRTEMLFGAAEVLVPAKTLVDGETVVIDRTESVEYFHVMLDDHEILVSEGLASESLYAGPTAIAGMAAEARAELELLFPELFVGADGLGEPALPGLRGFEGRVLARAIRA